jgi:hypothetical protein
MFVLSEIRIEKKKIFAKLLLFGKCYPLSNANFWVTEGVTFPQKHSSLLTMFCE